MTDSDHWSENGDTDEETEIEGEMESLYKFGFGEDWEELPTQDHRMLKRRARSASRRPRKGSTQFDILEEHGEEELDELDLAASLALARRQEARPKARRRGRPKPPVQSEKTETEKTGKRYRVVLAPRLGPRR